MSAYDDAVRAGVGLFIRTGTIDMDALARRLAVSRATLYRVVRGRDRLLGDVLWRQTVVLFDGARASAPGESMWYADLLSGREPSLDIAEHAARSLLLGGDANLVGLNAPV